MVKSKIFVNTLDNQIELMKLTIDIDLRIQPHASDSPINIHFIFNPSLESTLESRFFSKLSFSYGTTEFSAAREELERLGKEIDRTLETDNERAYKKGVEQ